MNRPLILLVDTDANYLIPLEEKITEELFGQVDLEVITDRTYFNSYFSTPRKIDTLIISEDLFSQELLRHNIENIFVLSEEMDESKKESDSVSKIFKYSSTKEILNQVLYKSRDILNVQSTHKETQVIVVSSAIGGVGKTVCSMALASSLAKNHKRVFFLSTDNMQGFSYYLENKDTLPTSICRSFAENDEVLYKAVMPYIRNEIFSYLPPFSRNIMSLGLDNGIYPRLIKALKEAKEYDYIIVDSSISFDEFGAKLLNTADKVLVLVLQDSFSTYKTQYLVQNIDCRNSDKFIFVCNKFRRDAQNYYLDSAIGQQFIISEYIDEVPLHKQDEFENYCELTGIRNLAYIFS